MIQLKKQRMIKLTILIMAFLLLFCLFGCQKTEEKSTADPEEEQYRKAQSLLAKEEYSQAAELFDGLGHYEDAARLSMFCKAVEAGEKGEYELAIPSFEILGDFKGSAFMCTYYKARQAESTATKNRNKWRSWIQAADTYDTIALFRDGKERAEGCRKAAYDYAVLQADAEVYWAAIEILNALEDYQDSRNLSRYYQAFDLEKSGDYPGASAAFTELEDYKDAAEQAEQVIARGYDKAVELETAGDYEGAYIAFSKLEGYKDAKDRAIHQYILWGEALREAHEWYAAIQTFKKAENEEEIAQQINETWYQYAKWLYDAGSYEGAYNICQMISGYKDVDDLLKNDDHYKLIRSVQTSSLSRAGNTVIFGRYEQDNNPNNGPEAIEWIVLDATPEKALLLSRYGLDCKPYHTKNEDVTWEDSTIRSWLNNEFMNTAFSKTEQSSIMLTNVSNSRDQGYYRSYSEDTQDNVFLLSYKEARQLLIREAWRDCIPTDYAMSKGAEFDLYNKSAGWWLRSSGDYQYYATIVQSNGKIYLNYVNNITYAVRPAIWIDLTTLE